jgi:phosphosulfolactate phosphohydrolase-like enzyme
LRDSKNGRALIAKNRSDDVEWCAQCSLFEVVGAMRDGVVRKI